jgi:ABC-type multidrug transport system fused ATPase/permease subunit
MNDWVLWLLIVAIICGLSIGFRTYLFTYVAEGVTMNMRRDVYSSTLYKHMGWHDVRTNNSGVINAMLSGDCSMLQGLLSDAIGV